MSEETAVLTPCFHVLCNKCSSDGAESCAVCFLPAAGSVAVGADALVWSSSQILLETIASASEALGTLEL